MRNFFTLIITFIVSQNGFCEDSEKINLYGALSLCVTNYLESSNDEIYTCKLYTPNENKRINVDKSNRVLAILHDFVILSDLSCNGRVFYLKLNSDSLSASIAPGMSQCVKAALVKLKENGAWINQTGEVTPKGEQEIIIE